MEAQILIPILLNSMTIDNRLVQLLYLIGIILLWFVAMWLYFGVRKRFASAKYAVEVIFIAIVFGIGAVARVLQSHLVLDSIYQIIGSSLAFEGLKDGLSNINIAISLWAGLTFFSIVMARANYEIFSYVNLRLRFEKNRSVYIFTALTEDSICLAKDIKKRHPGNNKFFGKDKCIIVFAGDDLAAFDRKNPLCREVMANGFYYWSYSDKGGAKGKKKSILRHLHIYNNNTACYGEKKTKLKKYLLEQKNNLKKIYDELNKEISRLKNEIIELKKEKTNKGNKTTKKIISKRISLISKKGKKIILFTKIKINALLIKLFGVNRINDKRIAIFSYAAAGYHPKEEQNSENVFCDIENLASEVVNGKWRGLKQLPIIEYHLLTRRDINYEVYQKWLDVSREKIKEEALGKRMQLCMGNDPNLSAKALFDKFKDEINKDLGKRMQLCMKNDPNLSAKALFNKFKDKIKLGDHIQLCVENEANLAAKDLIEKLKDKCKDRITSVLYPDRKDRFKLLLMGFGGTGQSALHAIYHITSNIYEKDGMLAASMFTVTACDSKIKDYSGLFDANHPYFICIQDDCTTISEKDGKTTAPMFTGIAFGNKIENSSTIDAKYSDSICAKEDCKKSYIVNRQEKLSNEIFNDYIKSGHMLGSSSTEDEMRLIKNQLQFPVVKFREQSCTEKEFFDMIDKDTGTDAKSDYNMFVVALGTDNRNITVANTLIADIKKEYRESPQSVKKTQLIAVNIRDCRNNTLLDWTDQDEKDFSSKLIVIRFGNSCDIYSYHTLLDNETETEYNHGYNSLYDFVNNKILYSKTDDFFACYEKLKEAKKNSNITSLESFFKYMVTADNNKNAKKEWLEVKLFQKESNCFAAQFKEIFLEKYNNSSIDDSFLKQLCALEHHRWCRFHIAAGWKYSHMADDNIKATHSKNKELKLHNNLIPFEMLKVNQLLDVINVAKSIYADCSDTKSKSEVKK